MGKTEIQQVLDALKHIHIRLLSCFYDESISAKDAYDTFFRENIQDAIALCEASLARVDEPIGYIDRAALSRLHTKCATIWPGTNEIDAVPVFAAPPPAVPPGWKLVPIEPTLEIIEAMCAAVATCMWPNDYHIDAQAGRRRNARLAYLEMLAACPKYEAKNEST